MMISQTFGVVYYVVGGGQIWTDIPAHFILVCVSQNESFIRVLAGNTSMKLEKKPL